MKLAYHGATSMKSDLSTDVAASARAGFRALEVWAAKVDDYLVGHSKAELRSLFTDNSIEPVTINSIEFIAFRGDEYRQIQVRCRELCQIAEIIGCPTVVVVPSPTPDRNMPWEKVVQEYVTVLRDLSNIAQSFEIRLAFEFLGFGWCTVRTPRAAYEIIQKADRDNVGLTLDACHFYGGGGLLNEIDALDPATIYAFHLDDMEDVAKEAITDSKRLLPGSGILPLSDICARLKGIGFDGLCSIELFRPEYWEWDPSELAVKAREAAISVLSPFFEVE